MANARTFCYGENRRVDPIVMVYSHWMSLGQVLGPGHRQMGCMVLCRTVYTAAEQGQGIQTHFSGPETLSCCVF